MAWRYRCKNYHCDPSISSSKPESQTCAWTAMMGQLETRC